MDIEEFELAQRMVEEGWEYRGTSDSGNLMFTRTVMSVVFSANIHRDR